MQDEEETQKLQIRYPRMHFSIYILIYLFFSVINNILFITIIIRIQCSRMISKEEMAFFCCS